jgi:hypothetical protein
MAGVAGPGIGHIIESGEEGFHVGIRLQRGFVAQFE